MSTLDKSLTLHQRLISWQWEHNTMALDVVRTFLGAALLIRGIYFLMSPESLSDLAGDRAGGGIEYYVIFAHLIGGALLLIGLGTRLAALMQIPILVDAVFFVHIFQGLATPDQSLELAGLVLVILVTLFIFGPGRYSMDYRLFVRKSGSPATAESKEG